MFANVRISFSWLSSIPLCVYICIYRHAHYSFVFIHLLMDSQVAIISNIAVNIVVNIIFQTSVLFSSNIYPRVKLLDHMVALFFVFFFFFEETVLFFHSGCTNCHFYQQSTKVAFLHILTNICYMWLFDGNHHDKQDFSVAQMIKNLPVMQGTLGLEDPLEKGVATHFNILVWRIQQTEELGGLQSVELQRVRRN